MLYRGEMECVFALQRKRNFVFHNFFKMTVDRSALLVPPKEQDNWSSIKSKRKQASLSPSFSLIFKTKKIDVRYRYY
jgi:hypothetical protein